MNKSYKVNCDIFRLISPVFIKYVKFMSQSHHVNFKIILYIKYNPNYIKLEFIIYFILINNYKNKMN